jgi:ATP-dependent Clp protease ATP-binding subunit ClpB
LQVLDEGRLTDNKGRVANFKNTIIIMTSNMGSDIIRERFEKISPYNEESIVEQTKREVMNLLKASIRPEFLNRIDETIMFRPLSKKDMRRIVEIQFRQICKRMEEAGIVLDATPETLAHLAELGYDPQFGARPLKRVLQKQLLNHLSKDILTGKVNKDTPVMIELDENGEIQFVNLLAE